MPVYNFSGQDSAGIKITGQRESTSSAALARDLRSEGLIPLNIDESTANQTGPTKETAKRRVKIRPNEIILFSHQMRSLMKAGISIVHAIRGLACLLYTSDAADE